MTPLTLDLAAAFDTSAGMQYGPWEFSPAPCLLLLYGEEVEPCGWQAMARLAAGDADAERWLAILRADAERRLRARTELGSLWESA